MTQATSPHRELPHAVFLRRLASDAPDSSLEMRLAQGAFLALRLVELVAPDRPPVHPDPFRYQHMATERFCRALPADGTETSHLVGLVRSTSDAFQEHDARLVVPALLAYAHYLEDELRLEEALDVLETLLEVGGERLAAGDAIGVQLRIGRVNRKLNRFDKAAGAYRLAGELADTAGDTRSVLLSRAGCAIALQGRGNLAEAERALRELSGEARASGHRDVEAGVEHAMGTTLLLRGQVAEGILHVWRAWELYEDKPSRLRALNDLGVMLLALGRVDDAERALLEVVRSGGARDNVSNALIELMNCASFRRDRIGFERRRSEGESRAHEMPPNILVDFYLKAGIGTARFGNIAKARWLMREALDIAKSNRLHEVEFRIERLMAGLSDCETELATKPNQAAEPAIGTDGLQDVSASLAKLGV